MSENTPPREEHLKPKNCIARSLNLDIALSTCGWSVTDLRQKHPTSVPFLISVEQWGVIRPVAAASKAANRVLCDIYTPRIISLIELRNGVRELIHLYKPDYVTTEDTFMYKWPSAYAALEQAITAIALMCFTEFKMPLYRIPTKNAKQSVTQSGASKKASVMECIQHSKTIVFKQKLSKEELNEHSADSIAVGHDFLTRVYPTLLKEQE